MGDERKTFFKTINRKLTTQEEIDKSAQHRQSLRDIDLLKAARSASTKTFNEDIGQKDALERELRRELDSGTIDEKVECYERRNDGRFEVDIFRAEGDVHIDTRPMTLEERREAMNPELPMDSAPDNVIPFRGELAATAEHTHGDEVLKPVEGCPACWDSTAEMAPDVDESSFGRDDGATTEDVPADESVVSDDEDAPGVA